MISDEQRSVCLSHGVEPVEAPADLKLGIAENVRDGAMPIHGLRHPPTSTTCGWYIWAGGELETHPDFFQPLHVAHIGAWTPLVERFLALPPGWRFLTDGEYHDIWFDEGLLGG